MKIFDKRPISLILCVALSGFVFFTRGIDYLRVAVPTVALTLFLISLFVKNQEKHTLALMRICSLVIILCSVLSYLYFDIYFFASNRFGDRVSIVGEVTEIDFESYNDKIEIKSESVNSKPFSKYKLVVYLEDEDAVNISIGSKVSFTALLSDFKTYDDDFDARTYYTSRGYSGVATEVSDFTVTENGNYTLGYKINSYRQSLCRKIISYSDEESGGLLCALLLGEREYLSKSTQLDFSRLGISHILALSGMHLAVLVLGLGWLLSLLGFDKKKRKLFEILFTLIYMALTGFPVSVVRAGLMLIISSLLFLFARSRDSITNLFIAVTLICIVQPYAVFDVSLWLSALATLGIIVYGEYKEEMRRKCGATSHGIKGYIKDALLVSVFAISSTLAITVTTYGEISLLAPLATLIFSLLAEVFMYAGTVFVLVCTFIPLGWIIRILGSVISEIAACVSSIKWIYVFSDFALTKAAVVVFTMLLFSFFLFDIKRKKTFVTAITLSLVAVFAVSAIFTYSAKSTSRFEYLRCGTDERILMQSDGETAIIDITSSRKSSSYDTLSLADNSKITSIEKYIYTSYSPSLLEGVTALLNNIYIDEIYIPAPRSKTDKAIFNELSDLCDKHKSHIVFYEDTDVIRNGDFTIFPVYYSSDERKCAFTILSDDEFYTYLSSGMLDLDSVALAKSLLDGAGTLILGSHGNSYKNYEFLYRIKSLGTLIISSRGVELPKATREFYSNAQIYYSPEKVELK